MLARLTPVARLEDALAPGAGWDALIVVAGMLPPRLPDPLEIAVRQLLEVDRMASTGPRLIVAQGAPGRRLVLAPTGSLLRDWDDVRRLADAAAAGVRMARDAGAVRPVIVLRGLPTDLRYDKGAPVALLGALAALWEPLEAREALGEEECEPVEELGFVVPEGVVGADLARIVLAIEDGRRLARDLAGTNPERMTPARMGELCLDAFVDTDVEIEILDDPDELRADYPLLFAVARASLAVPRHHPRVIRLVWEGEGPIERTLLLAGKGLSYDTGGADLKTGGHMAGMSRDKGGAAAVAGLVLTAARLRPRGLRIVAEIGAVRNSVGSDAFVTDEILVSHAGVRVRVGNTDAEGRLVLADLLSHLRVRAMSTEQPHICTVATLTGHAGLAVGPYTIAVDNGPARLRGAAARLQRVGEAWGDPFEISLLRRDDVDFVQPRSRADDVLSCNNKPSSQTPRGHQFPAAFLAIASGLDRHGTDGERPIPFTHIDVGGSAMEEMDWQHGRPTAAPVVALVATWVLGER
jgi:leucyl aminopeptidase